MIRYLNALNLPIGERANRAVLASKFSDDVWKLHAYGYPPSEIATILDIDEETVHDTIVRLWEWDKNAR